MKQNRIFYFIVKYFFKILLKIYNRCSVEWLYNLKPDDHVIIACNHVSYLDPLIAGCFFPRQLKYLAKIELFKFWPFKIAIEALGAVPVSRESGNSAAGALKGFMKLYREGNDVLIFPEGGRSPDGKLQVLEAGVGLIAAHEHAPILPAFIHGAFKAMPTGAFFVKPAKIKITFGKLIKLDEQEYLKRDAREIIMKKLNEAFQELEERN